MSSRYSPRSSTSSAGRPAASTSKVGSPAGSMQQRAGTSRFASQKSANPPNLDDDDADVAMVSRSEFDQMRKSTLEENISEADSDEDEVIALEDLDDFDVDKEPGARISQGGYGQDQSQVQDELSALRTDTPLKRIRDKKREARKARQDGKLWDALYLHQEVLGLAKLYAPRAVYAEDNKFPMLVSDAHFQLAKAYANLGCSQQANEHCNLALEAMPMHGQSHDQVAAFKLECNIMLAEMLLTSKPPKPKAALRCMYAAAGVGGSDSIQDLGMKVLASKCHVLLGTAKMDEADAARLAQQAVAQRVEALQLQLEGTAQRLTRERQDLLRNAEFLKQRKKLAEATQEFEEERNFKHSLLTQAREELDRAADLLMEVMAEEEDRMRKRVLDYKKHPLVQSLRRQACLISFKLSLVEGMDGDVKAQLRNLGEIASTQEVYGCVPLGLLAKVYQEQGAAQVAKAVHSAGDVQKESLKEALEVYNKLLDLQADRYENDEVRQSLARAETLKLIGNVYIAMRLWNRAQDSFQEAMDIYIMYKGPHDLVVQDLDHRINEVRSYT